MVLIMTEKPKCANPYCSNSAIIGIGRNLYCGKCAVKIMEIKKNQEEALIREGLKNGNKKY